MHSTNHVFGNTAIELAGRVVHPEYQALGIGTKLLRAYLKTSDTELLATYTRNPSVIKMISSVCTSNEAIYPMYSDSDLYRAARSMPSASILEDGVVYHLNRYAKGGLFGASDPASRPVQHDDSRTLKELFRGLNNARNALVVTARIGGSYE